jgi:hypothetical protein
MKINAKPLPKTRRAVSTRRSMISFDTPVDDRFDTPASYGAFAQQAY